MSRRFSNDSVKSTSSCIGKKIGKHSNKGDNNNDFVWDKYLQQTGMPAAPLECFKQQVFDESMPNKFKLYDKLEAKDARNPSAISVATIVMIKGPRLCLRLDGTDGCNDFWHLIDSKDIFPLGTCEAHGGLLQPPLGFTRNVSTWPLFLQRTLRGANQAHSDCFYQEPENPATNLFEIGMKLEAVDKKNPHLICPATIGDVDGDQVFISFDGWRGAFDYWCNYDSRDLFPINWCQKNDHPMQAIGPKGDNPNVVEKLKIVAEQRKRQTRSVKNSLEQKPPVKEIPVQTKDKPVRRRRVNSIKAPKIEEVKEDSSSTPSPTHQHPISSNITSDGSISSDDSDSSQDDGGHEKKSKLYESSSSSPSSGGQNKDFSSVAQYQKKKKMERRVRKQKRKQRKLAKALKRAGIAEGHIGEIKDDSIKLSLNLTPQQVALLTSPRKRMSGMENDYLKTKLKKKKKRRKLIETSQYTRMEGFGLKGNEPTTSTSTTSPTSPSFLEALTTPPSSLFGSDKSRIVRDATQGWPTRLQIGSVVTSDNKLGRFDKNITDKSQDIVAESVPPPVVESATTQCVSTTTNDADQATTAADCTLMSTDQTTNSSCVTSTTVISDASKNEEANNAVTSTTNPPPASTSLPPSSDVLLGQTTPKVTSTVAGLQASDKRRSRNPLKWSIEDVAGYVREKEPALHGHLALFRKHEIDGKAFLLLNSNNIVKYMSLKLGPALKLCSLVENLKACVEKHKRQKTKK